MFQVENQITTHSMLINEFTLCSPCRQIVGVVENALTIFLQMRTVRRNLIEICLVINKFFGIVSRMAAREYAMCMITFCGRLRLMLIQGSFWHYVCNGVRQTT